MMDVNENSHTYSIGSVLLVDVLLNKMNLNESIIAYKCHQ